MVGVVVVVAIVVVGGALAVAAAAAAAAAADAAAVSVSGLLLLMLCRFLCRHGNRKGPTRGAIVAALDAVGKKEQSSHVASDLDTAVAAVWVEGQLKLPAREMGSRHPDSLLPPCLPYLAAMGLAFCISPSP
jgi:hypothetical protein